MTALLVSLIGGGLALVGGGSARLMAQLSAALGRGRGLLGVGWIAAVMTSALAAWSGALAAQMLVDDQRALLAALVLALAAIRLAWPQRHKAAPVEPTHSLGAALLVLFAGQVGGAACLLVLAIAVGTGMPLPTAIGGTIGAGAMLTLAWARGGTWSDQVPLVTIRRSMAALCLIAAAWAAAAPLGLIG